MDKTFVSSSDRDSLLVSGDGKSYGRESEVTRDLTTQQLVDRSQVEVKAQDEILEQMSRGLEGLKSMGNAIRDETTLHMVRPCGRSFSAQVHVLLPHVHILQCYPAPLQKLLDNLENEVDAGNSNLKRETERTKIVTADAKTCWLYVVICISLAVLLLLVMLRWAVP